MPASSTPLSKAVSKAKSKPQTKATNAKGTLHIKSKPSVPTVPADMDGMIATAAYFLAQHRGFQPGRELEDWITAERQVRSQFGEPAHGAGPM